MMPFLKKAAGVSQLSKRLGWFKLVAEMRQRLGCTSVESDFL
jgi:hypothetical protein